VKDAHAASWPEAVPDLAHGALQVERHLRVGVPVAAGGGEGILAMVADVEEDDLEALGERPPERVVAVDGESVAIGDHEPHGVGARVATDTDDGAVAHGEVGALRRARNGRGHGPGRTVPRRPDRASSSRLPKIGQLMYDKERQRIIEIGVS